MNENTPPPSETPPVTPPEQPEGAPEGSPAQPLTAEEVENQWRHRVSQKDRAHAAAEQALRDENDALKRQMDALSKPRPQSNGQSAASGSNDQEVEALRAQLETQRRALEDEQKARTIDTRKAKYPALARNIGDAGNSIFATADEATLARLNAQYDDGSSTGTFASATPRKQPAAPVKTLGDMTKAEIEAELRKSVERGDLTRR